MRYLSPKRQNVGGRPVPEATKGVNCKVAEGIEEVLRLIAPGTPIRNGLENILNAKTGALIAVADSDQVMNLVDGGFKLDVDFSPAKLYELAKMDGAIILSPDFKKILYANTCLLYTSDAADD